MKIKDLFGDSQSKIATSTVIPLTSLSGTAVTGGVESSRYMNARSIDKDRFVPPVDFSKIENFARYGSAEEYYRNAVKHVYATYPYDGSAAEKQEWHNDSSDLENFIFNFEYPRTTGYAMFSPGNDAWGTRSGSLVNTFGLPDKIEYIQVKGGPHTSTRKFGDELTGSDTPGDWTSGFANVYDESTNRKSNLQLDFDKGVTVEFWMKKPNRPGFGKTFYESVFDVWNGSTTAASYGRLLILLSHNGMMEARVSSGSADIASSHANLWAHFNDLQNNTFDNNWHHYAISFKNTASKMETTWYKDGKFFHSSQDGNNLQEISGDLVANIGALRIPAHIQSHAAGLTTAQKIDGYGKLTGSIDEFRFWKTARSAQEIGRNYFTSVHGATNDDLSNDADLGIYYKFNEGITGDTSLDSVVLDYSGRISNGEWVVGSRAGNVFASSFNGLTCRSTDSAMDAASSYLDFSGKETKDPILRSTHPEVSSYLSEKIYSASFHDDQNGNMIYHTLPSWVTEEDATNGYELKKICQVMASYLDMLYLQIQSLPKLRHMTYSEDVSGSKPYPFMKHMLAGAGFRAPDLFTETTPLQNYFNRDEKFVYEDNLNDVKNLIYRNIYNNLTYIYKTKGTEKSFRNLVRCFGVDDEIYKLNVYSTNAMYDFKTKYKNVSVKRNFVDFYETRWPEPTEDSRFNASVYGYGDISGSSQTRSIPGVDIGSGHSFTFECETLFPRKTRMDEDGYVSFNSAKSSIFGLKSVEAEAVASGEINEQNQWTEGQTLFKVYANRTGLSTVVGPPGESQDATFKCQLSNGTVLTSPVYKDVYENQEWLFAVNVAPDKKNTLGVHESSAAESGGTGTLTFTGICTAGDFVSNSFVVTQSLDTNQLSQFLTSSKRPYCGANWSNWRPNVEGNTLIEKSDIKVAAMRGWLDDLDYEELEAHAKDATNHGRLRPSQSAFLFQTGSNTVEVPRHATIIYNWNFDNVTKADSSGNFPVYDISSGSYHYLSPGNTPYVGSTDVVIGGSHADGVTSGGSLDYLLSKKFEAQGKGFPASTQAVDRTYALSAKHLPPEFVYSSDQIKILSDDDINFTRTTRPSNTVFRIEKSMNQVISEDMLNMFAGVEEFNNLIGEPVHKYRQEYKGLNLLRKIYFNKVGNTPDVDKFINYYSWLDDSVAQVLRQIMPMSADVSDKVSNVVESHVFERNKYWHKFPSMEFKQDDPEGGLSGIQELRYPWKEGHAPITPTYKISDLDGQTIELKNGIIYDSGGGNWRYSANEDFVVHVDVKSFEKLVIWYDTYGSDDTLKIYDGTQLVPAALLATLHSGGHGTTVEYSPDWFTSGYVTLKWDSNGSGYDDGFVAEFISLDHMTNHYWQKNRKEESDESLNTLRTVVATELGTTLPTLSGSSGAYSGNTFALRSMGKTYQLIADDSSSPIASMQEQRRNLEKKSALIRATQNTRQIFGQHRGVLKFNDPTTFVEIDFHQDPYFHSLEKKESDMPSGKKAINTRSRVYRSGIYETGSYDAVKSGQILPFVVNELDASGSTNSYATKYWENGISSVGFNNMHLDRSGVDSKDTPMQGPFTEKYVGGLQYRHQRLNIGATDSDVVDDPGDAFTTRVEGWRLTTPGSSGINFTTLVAQSFDGGNFGTWTQGQWTIGTGYTPTANTGPSAAKDDTYYAFVEATDQDAGAECFVYTPLLDAIDGDSAFSSGSFWYHMHGADCGTLEMQYQLDDGDPATSFDATGNWQTKTIMLDDGTEIDQLVGEHHASATTAWKQASFTLGELAGQRFYIRFKYVTGLSALGDVAIDKFNITDADLSDFRLYDPNYLTPHTPKGIYYRDEVAKRPVNIRNIQQSATMLGTIIGNFSKNYELVQTSDSLINNFYFKKTVDLSIDAKTPSNYPIEQTERSGLTSSFLSPSKDSHGVYFDSYPLHDPSEVGEWDVLSQSTAPDRSIHSNKSVIVERFNSPGESHTMRRSSLDFESEQMSPNNALPWRNRLPIEAHDALQTTHFDLQKHADLLTSGEDKLEFYWWELTEEPTHHVDRGYHDATLEPMGELPNLRGHSDAHAFVGDAYNTTSGYTEVFDMSSGGASGNKWSSAITSLPFDFRMGTKVYPAGSGWVISKNGLITFDASLATAIVNTAWNDNVQLKGTVETPMAVPLPFDTICAFWDNWDTIRGVDKIYVKTEGTAPYRQYVIKGHSTTIDEDNSNDAADDGTYHYWACVLEETTNNIYFISMVQGGSGDLEDSTIGISYGSSAAQPHRVVEYGSADNKHQQYDNNGGDYSQSTWHVWSFKSPVTTAATNHKIQKNPLRHPVLTELVAEHEFSTKSMDFDTNDCASVTYENTDDAIKNTNKFTISAWFKLDSLGVSSSTIAMHGDAHTSQATARWRIYVDTNGRLFGVVYDSDGDWPGGWVRQYTAISAISADTWHHVAMTFDVDIATTTTNHHDKIKIYIDGNDVSGYGDDQNSPDFSNGLWQQPSDADDDLSSAVLTFAARQENGSLSHFLNGFISEASFWNRALTSKEIKEIYSPKRYLNFTEDSHGPGDLHRHSAAGHLLGWWRFGDAQGDSVSQIRNVAFDEAKTNLLPLGNPTLENVVPDAPKYYTTTIDTDYDNAFVSHAIPQSDRQYSWITASIENHSYTEAAHNATFGFASSSSDIHFVDQSMIVAYNCDTAGWNVSLNYDANDDPDAISGWSCGAYADSGNPKNRPGLLQQGFTHITLVKDPLTASTNTLGLPAGSPLALEASYDGQYANQVHGAVYPAVNVSFVNPTAAPIFNLLINYRQGPYGWPSWKQIRGGEHPIARTHRNNNILSVIYENRVQHPTKGMDPLYGENVRYLNLSESCVVGKYKPVSHLLDVNGDMIALRSTYGNNLCKFSHGWLNRYLNFDKTGEQTHEQLYEMYSDPQMLEYSPIKAFLKFKYKEVVFPREINTYRKKIRSRVHFEENERGFRSRGFERWDSELFWRDDPDNRRKAQRLTYDENQVGNPYIESRDLDTYSYKTSNNTIHVFAAASSVGLSGAMSPFEGYWAHDRLVGMTTIEKQADLGQNHSYQNFGYHQNVKEQMSMWPMDVCENVLNSAITASQPSSLISASTMAMGSEFEIDTSNGTNLGEGYYNYYGLPKVMLGTLVCPSTYSPAGHRLDQPPRWQMSNNSGSAANEAYHDGWFLNNNEPPLGHPMQCTFVIKPQVHMYRNMGGNCRFELKPSTVHDMAGRGPFHDSYEEWSNDLFYGSKEYSILPEFRISEHINYYVKEKGGNFLSENKKVLSLRGAELSSSAASYSSGSLDYKFYRDYSNSDFMEHFDYFVDSHEGIGEISTISLTCKAIKKLLPYNGFYPSTRIVQLAQIASSSYDGFLSGSALLESQGFEGLSQVDAPTWSVYPHFLTAQGNDANGEALGLPSGNPYYAQRLNSFWSALISPGVLLNSIKAGVAVDFPTYEPDSSVSQFGSFGASLQGQPTTRIPFEAIVDQQSFMPKSPQAFEEDLINIDPSKLLSEDELKSHGLTVMDMWLFLNKAVGDPIWALWNGRNIPSFEMATHNFVSEVPSFFLAGNGSMTTFASDVEHKLQTMRSGSAYYMDVVMYKTPDLVTSEGPRRVNMMGSVGHSTSGWHGRRGAIYGPAISGGFDSDPKQVESDMDVPQTSGQAGLGDPNFAPWTPPYFYGRSICRIKFEPHKAEVMDQNSAKKFTFDDIFSSCEVEYRNEHHRANVSSGDDIILSSSWMQLSSSVNIFNVARKPTIEVDPITSREKQVSDGATADANIWTISTKWECPVLDFSLGIDGKPWTSHGVSKDPRKGFCRIGYMESEGGSEPNKHDNRTNSPLDESWLIGNKYSGGKGLYNGVPNDSQPYWILGSGSCRTLWNTYGAIPSSDKGVYMSVEESFPEKSYANIGRSAAKEIKIGATGSLAQVCGFKTTKEKIGQIAEAREISECVVAVPYLTRPTKELLDSKRIFKLKDMNRYVFKIDGLSWALQNLHKAQTGAALPKGMIFPDSPQVKDTSITVLKDRMEKYVFPPKMDFLKNIDDVKPFVMYTFEFNSVLDQQDLSDIWQGVMPKLSLKAEKEKVTVSHTNSSWEFFGGKPIPSNVKWMVFKVKKKARTNYWELIKDAESSEKYKFKFDLSSKDRKTPDYSYNWPYDYFSLVELAQLESEIVIDAKKDE